MAPKTNRKELEESIKNQIISMSKAGLSGQNIADYLGLIKSTVNHVIKRYAIFDTVMNRSGRGWHKKLSECDQRHIK